jgi:hypothetical protein
MRPSLASSVASVAVAALLASCGSSGTPGEPVIRITSHADGQEIIGSRTITMAGTLLGAKFESASVIANGIPVAATIDGTRFSATVTLLAGRNTIEAEASAAGRIFRSGPVHLLYPFVALSTFQPAALVIGQPDFATAYQTPWNAASASTLNYTYGNVALDPGGRLFLPDSNDSRILVFDAFPTRNGASADHVLGQTDFTTTTWGSGPDRLSMPNTVHVAGGKLFIADANQSRVLIFNSVPSATGAAADVAVGWSNPFTPRDGCAADQLLVAQSLFAVDGKLLVADTGNHRVLIWNTIPAQSGVPADLVLGQKDTDHCAWNDESGTGTVGAAPTARTLAVPTGVWSDGRRVIVSDEGNARVLIWTTFPTASHTPADLVLGQPDFTSHGAPGTRAGLSTPSGVSSNGNQIAVADVTDSRVLIWNSFPAVSGAPADVVLGQGDFTHGAPNDADQDGMEDATPSANTLRMPMGVTFLGEKLVVTDSHNFRYLVFQGP